MSQYLKQVRKELLISRCMYIAAQALSMIVTVALILASIK